MPPIQTLFMNSIVGLNGVSVPPQSLSYMMGTVSDPQTFNDEMNFQEDTIVGGSELMNSRQGPPQVPVGSMIGTFALNAGIEVAWIMATSDDPKSSGNWTIHSDRYGNEVGNYPPQIGSGGI